MSDPWLALDIGGANLKAAHSCRSTRSVPFALWKHPDLLPEALSRLASGWPPYRGVAVTMTGELCDCFPTKAAGVKAILDAVEYAFPGRKLHIWTSDGTFTSHPSAMIDPGTAAASNWVALATWAARRVTSGLLIDIGSTTTDLIPLRDGRIVPIGRTDTGRLRSGELVYAGAKRTPVCALATALPHRGAMTGLAAELFATTQDVYLTLGDLADDPEDRSTADGRAATRAAARDRLARMVGADREGFSDDDASAFALAADSALMDRLTEAAWRVSRRSPGGAPASAVISGSGEFLARRVAERVVAPGGGDREPVRPLGPRGLGLRVRLRPDAAGGRVGGAGVVSDSGPIVVAKLGGSLLDWPDLPSALGRFLADRRARGHRLALVVGGGGAADWVRDLDRIHALGEEVAHHLAIRSLDLTARAAVALVPGLSVAEEPAELAPLWRSGLVPVIAPRRWLSADASGSALPHTWAVTSDAIAARVAVLLGAAELVLLKSTSVPFGTTREEAASLGVVDPAFASASRGLPRAVLLNLRGDIGGEVVLSPRARPEAPGAASP